MSAKNQFAALASICYKSFMFDVEALETSLDERGYYRVGCVLDDAACKALIETANARGSADNLTAAVFIMCGATPFVETGSGTGWRGWLDSLFGRRR